jgi:DNA polymerase (family 10)
LLHGIECDILADGSLDFPEAFLASFDFVIVSIHSSLSQDETTMTRRLIRAIESHSSHIVGHVTGRLLLRRKPYRVDVAKVIDACIANRKIIELNGNPSRMDMDWRLWHTAADKGLLCCVNTDAHSIHDLAYIEGAIRAARKGWLEARHVINTLPLAKLQKFF